MGAADDFLDGGLNADKFLDAGPAKATSVAANLAHLDRQQADAAFTEPTSFAYLFNRLKKGFAGFVGLPGDFYQGIKPTAKNLREMARNPSITMPDQQRQDMEEQAGQMDIAPPSDALIDRIAAKPVATSADYRGVLNVDEKMKTGSDLKRYAGGVAEMAGAGGPFGLTMQAKNLPALVTSVTGSGIGMEAGGDVASGLGLSRQGGEAVGALVGGGVSAITPNAVTATAGFLKNRFSPAANKARAESQVGREISGQLESYPPAADNIERSLQISDEIPGFTPSLPARSGAPGLLAEERRLVAQNPKTLNRAVQNVEDSQRAVDEFVNAKFPEGGKETAMQRVQKLAKVKADRLEGIKTALDEKLDDSLRVFEANPSNYENGTRLRDLFFKQKQVYAGIRSQKYQDVYDTADRLGAKANIDDAASYAKGVLESELNAYQASEIPPALRQLAKESGEISFAKLHSLYKRTNADLASLRGSTAADKDFRIHLLEGLKDKLAQNIANFEGQGFGDVATKLKEANRFYVEEYLPRFKQGFGGDVAAKYPSGEFRTPDQMVTELITKRPNNTQAAKDFKHLFDEVPEAWQALRNGYLDELYRNGGIVTKEGRINQRGLDTFLRKHEPTLAEFPQVKEEIRQLALDNQGLLTRRAEIVAAEKKLAAKDLFKLFQGRDPDVILTEAATNANAMRVLAYQARNDKGMAQGLARGIAEHVTAQPDPATFLAANEQAIRLGLKPMGDEHFKNLQTAVEAMTINSRSQMPANINAGSVVPDSMAEKLGSSPRAIISHILNVERGRTGAVQEGAAFLGRWFDKLRRDHKAIAMEAVFYDKDVARALANLAKEPKSEKTRMDFATQMTALGVRAEVAAQQ